MLCPLLTSSEGHGSSVSVAHDAFSRQILQIVEQFCDEVVDAHRVLVEDHDIEQVVNEPRAICGQDGGEDGDHCGVDGEVIRRLVLVDLLFHHYAQKELDPTDR